MHQCLLIPETVQLICAHFRPTNKHLPTLDAANTSTLAALAQTCRYFANPALDALWVKQIALTPLLCCLPGDCFAIDLDEAGVSHGRWARPIFAGDWSRLDFYAARVRVLNLDESSDAAFSAAGANFFNQLAAGAPSGGLFPKLRVLYSRKYPHVASCLRMFLAPTLRTLRVYAKTEREHRLMMTHLSTLPSAAPQLTSLLVYTGEKFFPRPPHFDAAVSSILRRMHSLEKVTMGCPDIASLQHIGRLDSLRTLSVVDLPVEFQAVKKSKDAKFFPRLLELVIRRGDILTALAFLRLSTHAPYKRISITTAGVVSNPELERLFAAVASACRPTSLRTLVLHAAGSGGLARVGAPAIRPLLAFRNLAHVELLSSAGWALDGDAVRELACAWPLLRTLSLETSAMPGGAAPVLASLEHLAAHCPHLASLKTTVDATVAVPDVLPSAKRVRQTRLAALHVQNSDIADALAVARYLSRLFPALQDIKTHRDGKDNSVRDNPNQLTRDMMTQHWRWKDVERMLPHFAATRREESQYAMERL
ncbi:unnamed protein product [Mycena citricolor]|uniref:F-box domain-containing protein n=1 Tax=Mycena citricolor TaxID=2018698 RepID=A0AAD2HYA9_9AGAR|nr:unnamed protein product [Mycena citricolor]